MPVEAVNNRRMPERFLEADHASLGKLFEALPGVLDERDVARSFELLDLIWARLAIHIRAEHLCLFPAILEAPTQRFSTTVGSPQFTEAQSTLKLLRDDHDFFMHELASAVNTLRSLKNSGDVSGTELDEVRVKVSGVCARLKEHNCIEEEQVYRWVALLLTEEEQAELLARIEREFEKQPPRFEGRAMFSTDSAS